VGGFDLEIHGRAAAGFDPGNQLAPIVDGIGMLQGDLDPAFRRLPVVDRKSRAVRPATAHGLEHWREQPAQLLLVIGILEKQPYNSTHISEKSPSIAAMFH